MLGNHQDDLAIASLGKMVRGSDAMIARRRRILGVARTMLAEGGAEGLAMRLLARRADVSLRTLYNAFGSKERLILAAIQHYYDRFLDVVCEARDLREFACVIETMLAINLRNQQIRPYLAALVAINFSAAPDPALRAELRRVAAGFMLPWLQALEACGQLAPGADTGRIITNLANLQYAINQEWLTGALADDAFIHVVLEAVLTFLAGCLQGDAADAVRELLNDIRGEAIVADGMIEAGRERLARLFASTAGLWPTNQGGMDAASIIPPPISAKPPG